MENTETKNKVCFRCRHFGGYYTKGYSRFERSELGYCREHHKIMGNMNTCDCWRSRFAQTVSAKRTSMKVLAELLNDITAIRQILEEEREEERELR